MRAEVQLLVRIDPKIRRAMEKLKRLTGETLNDQARAALEKYTQERLPRPAE